MTALAVGRHQPRPARGPIRAPMKVEARPRRNCRFIGPPRRRAAIYELAFYAVLGDRHLYSPSYNWLPSSFALSFALSVRDWLSAGAYRRALVWARTALCRPGAAALKKPADTSRASADGGESVDAVVTGLPCAEDPRKETLGACAAVNARGRAKVKE